jgi:hypothetical protein
MGFDKLNHDCIRYILEWVDEVSPATTRRSVRFVNKDFHATSRVVGHRRKTLRYPALGLALISSPSETDAASWLRNDDILRGLHYLTVKDFRDADSTTFFDEVGDWAGNEDSKFDELVTLLAKLGNLKNLNWSYTGPVPLKVLEALHKYHPKARLQVYNFTRLESTQDHTDPAEIALSNSPALTAIKASIWNQSPGRDGQPDLREAAFRRIVANAPNLSFASIVTGQSGCMVYIPSREDSDKLETLTAKFLTHNTPNSALRNLTLDGYSLNERTLKDWGTLVDLSKLESIKCSRGFPDTSYFNYAPQVLKSLTHVSLNLSSPDDSLNAVVQKYLSEIAPLESLSLWSWMGSVSLDTILSRHGKTLKSLQLHERETTASYGELTRKLLTLDDLNSIKANCPNLRAFTLDLDRHTQELDPDIEMKQYADKLRTLGSMNLDALQIYYDLGLPVISEGFGHGASESEEVDFEQQETSRDDRPDGGDTNDVAATILPQSPPHKRVKKSRPRQFLEPSMNEAIEPFVKDLWKTVFGSRSNGAARALDVKFGEWERKMGIGYPAAWVRFEQALRTWWVVRPHERDDRPGECVVTKHGGGLNKRESGA